MIGYKVNALYNLMFLPDAHEAPGFTRLTPRRNAEGRCPHSRHAAFGAAFAEKRIFSKTLTAQTLGLKKELNDESPNLALCGGQPTGPLQLYDRRMSTDIGAKIFVGKQLGAKYSTCSQPRKTKRG